MGVQGSCFQGKHGAALCGIPSCMDLTHSSQTLLLLDYCYLQKAAIGLALHCTQARQILRVIPSV